MKKIIGIIIVLVMIMSIALAVSFSDLSSSHWAYGPISEMAGRGILIGYPDGTFLPENPVTRAEFSKIMVLALKLQGSKKTSFEDVPDSHWAKEYVSVASSYLAPYRNESNKPIFKPSDSAIREEVCVAMVKACGLEYSDYDLSVLKKFSDYDQITSNLRKYVAIAVKYELMRGHENGTFEPKGLLTRAQICQLVRNAEDVKKRIEKEDEGGSGTGTSSNTSEPTFDISYNEQGLYIDLGANWKDYYFTSIEQNDYKKGLSEGIVYTPSQRYLKYDGNYVGEGKRDSFDYNLTDKKTQFIAIYKDNMKKTKKISFATPFNISVNGKVASDYETDELVIKASGTNEIQTITGWWDKDQTTYKTAEKTLTIKVPFVGIDRLSLVIKDVQGNEIVWRTNVTNNKQNAGNTQTGNEPTTKPGEIVEYFKDIVFNKNKLTLDLGKYWKDYSFACLDEKRTPYEPSSQELSYRANTSTGKGSSGLQLSNSYDLFNGEDKITLRVSLRSDDSQYKDVEILNPFLILISDPSYDIGTGNNYMMIRCRRAYNTMSRIDYKIDKGTWISDSEDIDASLYWCTFADLNMYVDGTQHSIMVRFIDEYGNYKEDSKTFKVDKKPETTNKEYFKDITFDNQTLTLDLGQYWQSYKIDNIGHNSNNIVPPRQILKYSDYLFNLFQDKADITLRVHTSNVNDGYKDVNILNPFRIVISNPTENSGMNNHYCITARVYKAYHNIVKAQYNIDSKGWKDISTQFMNNSYWEVVFDAEEYRDGLKHDITYKFTDQYNNAASKGLNFEIAKKPSTNSGTGTNTNTGTSTGTNTGTQTTNTIRVFLDGMELVQDMQDYAGTGTIPITAQGPNTIAQIDAYWVDYNNEHYNNNLSSITDRSKLNVTINTNHVGKLRIIVKDNKGNSVEKTANVTNTDSTAGGIIIYFNDKTNNKLTAKVGDSIKISAKGNNTITTLRYIWTTISGATEKSMNGSSGTVTIPNFSEATATLRVTAIDTKGNEKKAYLTVTKDTSGSSTGTGTSSGTGTSTVAVSGITISPTSPRIEVGATKQLTATILPSNATNKKVTWSSSDSTIAMVSTTGVVMGKKVGTAKITATSQANSNISATSTVTVVASSSAGTGTGTGTSSSTIVDVTSVTLNSQSASLDVGKTLQLSATVKPINASNKTVSWSSSNNSVATVSSNGLVTAKAVGTAAIKAQTSNGKYAICNITVQQSHVAIKFQLVKNINGTTHNYDIGSQVMYTKSENIMLRKISGTLDAYDDIVWQFKIDGQVVYKVTDDIRRMNISQLMNNSSHYYGDDLCEKDIQLSIWPANYPNDISTFRIYIENTGE